MGRRNRLRQQAVASGVLPSAREQKTRLMHEVVRLASRQLFFDAAIDDMTVERVRDYIAKAMFAVLPEAIRNTNSRYFTIDELSKPGDWQTMGERIIQGIGSRGERFRKHDRNGEWWKLRKGKSGRKPTGWWVLCAGCGVPRWATPSRPTKMCRDCWRQRGKKEITDRRSLVEEE